MRHLAPIIALAVSLSGCVSRQQSDCCSTVPVPTAQPQPVTVVDSVEPIKAAFNVNADKPRVLSLVSPGCPTGDVYETMERMGRDVLGSPQAVSIELLGFPNCPNTPVMRENLRAALESVGGGLTFRDVNQEALPESDIRRSWPTPTVLVGGTDLFGMAPPSAPTMGCRMYAGGVPDAATIASHLEGRR